MHIHPVLGLYNNIGFDVFFTTDKPSQAVPNNKVDRVPASYIRDTTSPPFNTEEARTILSPNEDSSQAEDDIIDNDDWPGMLK